MYIQTFHAILRCHRPYNDSESTHLHNNFELSLGVTKVSVPLLLFKNFDMCCNNLSKVTVTIRKCKNEIILPESWMLNKALGT